MTEIDWAVVVPMANEASQFEDFIRALSPQLDETPRGTAYLVVDRASSDETPKLAKELAERDARFVAIWAPENKSVVDAYRRGLAEAFRRGHQTVIEMDAGLSHDPAELPEFISAIRNGADCAFGFRFRQPAGSHDSSLWRRTLSKTANGVSNLLLRTQFQDMTSGYQAFSRATLEKVLALPLRSKAHFYHAELKFYLRKSPYVEIPIRYQNPSPRVSPGAILDSLRVLLLCSLRRGSA